MGLFLLFACLGAVFAYSLPNKYRASASMVVESAQISDDLLSADVGDAASEQLELLESRLMTRSNLIEIANEFGVVSADRGLDGDAIVDKMRNSTRIVRRSGRGRPSFMSISFTSTNPKVAADVVNKYVSIVLEDNAKDRSGRTEGTLQFFEQQVSLFSSELDEQSKRIAVFKEENANALPENLANRLNRKNEMQERIARSERELNDLAEQRERVTSIYASTGTLQDPTARLTPQQQRLADLQEELNVALTIYSDSNPRVITLRSRIEALQGVLSGIETTNNTAPINPEEALLEISLADIDSRIDNAKQVIEDSEAELISLNESIAKTPGNEIALSALERELVNIQTLYNNAVGDLASARMINEVEVSAQGERISILESATVPSKPSGPNRTAIAGVGAAAGLGVAGMLFVLLELLNQTPRRAAEVTRSLGVVPLAALPIFETPRAKLLRRAKLVTAFIFVLIGVPAALWVINTYYMPLDTIYEQILTTLA